MSKPHPAPDDPFFIGWLPPPRAYRAFLLAALAGLLVAAAGVAALVALGQRSPGTGTWDDENLRAWEGVAYAEPYARLRVPGRGRGEAPRTVLLVEEGKFGAKDRVRPFDGQPVRVTGTLLHREGRLMVELSAGPDGIGPAGGMPGAVRRRLARPDPEPRGRVRLKGEIIDPKCYLGAMKPGGGKTHKACAALCLAGGVPPMFVTRAAGGGEVFYLLTAPDGGPLGEAVHPFVGDPVELTGELEGHDDLLVLKVSAADVRRR